MREGVKRATVLFPQHVHEALRRKASMERRSISDVVNDAVWRALQEDIDDLRSLEERAHEEVVTREELVRELDIHGAV